MDQIRIREISGEARIGVTEEERREPQKILVDVVLFLDLEAAANTDDLTLTVDYSRVVQMVLEVMGARSYTLLEALTGRICECLLADGRVDSVRVEAHKYPQPLQSSAKAVAVRMRRGSWGVGDSAQG